jgi:hypothetical protein
MTKDNVMPLLDHPIFVISVNDDTRAALTASLTAFDVELVQCSTFLEAEDLALKGMYCGILVDLPSIVKAKSEEKIVACSLTGFFPTLRVRLMGTMLIPMTMPGAAKQENSVSDFINRACYNFSARQLRAHHRHVIGISVATRRSDSETRAFTLDISWGGAFIVDFNPERFELGDELTVFFQEPGCEIQAQVCWKQSWGLRHAPGIGVKFLGLTDCLSEFLLRLLKHAKDHDRDRLVA